MGKVRDMDVESAQGMCKQMNSPLTRSGRTFTRLNGPFLTLSLSHFRSCSLSQLRICRRGAAHWLVEVTCIAALLAGCAKPATPIVTTVAPPKKAAKPAPPPPPKVTPQQVARM